MKRRIGVEGFRIIEAYLRGEALEMRESQPLAATGLVQAACFDGTDLPAWSSRDPHDTRRDLGDPEARVGRGKKGFILGYQSLFLVDIEGLPLGHEEAPVNVNEKELVEPLLDRVLGEGLEMKLAVGDSQFESQNTFDALEDRKMGHIIDWRRMKGRVKSRLAYRRLTWQGLENASIHVSIVMCVVYAAVIAAALVGRPELRYSIAHFA